MLYSLFEEHLRREQHNFLNYMAHGSDSDVADANYIPSLDEFHSTSDSYLEHIRKAREAVGASKG